jgi:hypothetical protein
MAYTLEKSVIKEIERIFPPEHREYVRSRLAARELPMDRSAPPPRVHIAVIWLSKADLNEFDLEMEGAAIDWRDTLVAAGLANVDWREKLMAMDIDCRDW